MSLARVLYEFLMSAPGLVIRSLKDPSFDGARFATGFIARETGRRVE
jgi:hypothetical protein